MSEKISWFKSDDKEKQESLQQVINASTAERTAQIEQHIQSQISNIKWQIEEIDDYLIPKTAQNEQKIKQQEQDLRRLQQELHGSLEEIRSKYKEYAEQYPEFQKTFQKYQETSKTLETIIASADKKQHLSDTEGQKWEEEKEYLLQELSLLENAIKHDPSSVDEGYVPPSLN